jgi:hypothetical protein
MLWTKWNVLNNRLEAENTYLQNEMNVVTNFENIITPQRQDGRCFAPGGSGG